MKLLSWNVNGLRACRTKGFDQFAYDSGADMICLQETKMQPEQVDFSWDGYQTYWNSAVKKGYSGTGLLTRETPLSVSYDIGIPEHGEEGRVITAEYDQFYLVTVYTPNAQRGLTRLDYRMEWEDAFRPYLLGLDAKKPVIVCGDLNVAHQEIDLKNARSNRGNAGFTEEEREKFSLLLQSGFVDTFRYLYPDVKDAYSWWSYMGNARANNTGWRIDYFLVSDRIKGEIKQAAIHPQILGSDHCPVELEIF